MFCEFALQVEEWDNSLDRRQSPHSDRQLGAQDQPENHFGWLFAHSGRIPQEKPESPQAVLVGFTWYFGKTTSQQATL
jgi:hypothetical protein